MKSSPQIFSQYQGPEVMELDRQVLEGVEAVRIAYYTWPQKSISLGCLFDPGELLDLDVVKERGWQFFRRVTGGGAMFHGKDICFSIAIPSNHPLFFLGVMDSYRVIHSYLKEAISDLYPHLKDRLTFASMEHALSMHQSHAMSCCLLQPTAYDLLLNGKKVAGCAQRRRKGLVHQISLSLEMPDRQELKKLFRKQQDIDTIIGQNYAALGSYFKREPTQIGNELSHRLAQSLKEFSI